MTNNISNFLPNTVLKIVIEQLENPSRKFHTYTNHVLPMINMVNDELSKHLNHFDAVILACLFHDVIYDCSNIEDYQLNESRSAHFMINCLRQHTELLNHRETFKEVMLASTFINATKHHNPKALIDILKPDEYTDLQIFLDLDMMVFSTSKIENMLTYENQIREEFSSFSDEIYYNKRIELLQLFGSNPVYSSMFFSSFNGIAKRNIDFLVDYLKRLTQ